MTINKKNTKTLQVALQEKVAVSTVEEMKKTEAEYTHKCVFCPRRFKTAWGLKIHAAVYNFQLKLTEEEFEIDDINAVFGTLEQRWFRVCWKDHPGKDSWDPEPSGRKAKLIRAQVSSQIRTMSAGKSMARSADCVGLRLFGCKIQCERQSPDGRESKDSNSC